MYRGSLGPTGAATPTTAVTGTPTGQLVVDADGTAYQTVSNAGQTTVLVVGPTGVATPTTVAGNPQGSVVVGPIGIAYQMTDVSGTTRVWLVGASPDTASTL